MARPTILVADDHILVLKRVLSLLEGSFDVVGVANNGCDLIAEAQRFHPDVIVLDITMPGLNGIEAAHALHDAGSTAKLVFLTIHDQPAFLEACFAEGGLGYVTKSRMGKDLIPAINEALADHRFISPTVPY